VENVYENNSLFVKKSNFDNLLFPSRFLSVHQMDTLLSPRGHGIGIVTQYAAEAVTWQWQHGECSTSDIHSYYSSSYCI